MTRAERIERAAVELVAEAERTLGTWPGAHRSHPFLWSALDRLHAALAASPAPVEPRERVPQVSCRSCGEGTATRWAYSPSGVGYAVCGECDTSSITGPPASPAPVTSGGTEDEPAELCRSCRGRGGFRPDGRPTSDLRIPSRKCMDCGGTGKRGGRP
jgi:hypothetical protein